MRLVLELQNRRASKVNLGIYGVLAVCLASYEGFQRVKERCTGQGSGDE